MWPTDNVFDGVATQNGKVAMIGAGFVSDYDFEGLKQQGHILSMPAGEEPDDRAAKTGKGAVLVAEVLVRSRPSGRVENVV